MKDIKSELHCDGCLPVFMDMTDGKVHDATAVKELSLPKDAVVVADRAYVDFATLWRRHTDGS